MKRIVLLLLVLALSCTNGSTIIKAASKDSVGLHDEFDESEAADSAADKAAEAADEAGEEVGEIEENNDSEAYEESEAEGDVENKDKRKFSDYKAVLSYNEKVREKYSSNKVILDYFREINSEHSENDMWEVTDKEKKQIKKQAHAITKGLETDYEKSKAIYDWVTENFWFYAEEKGSHILDYSKKYADSWGMAAMTVEFHKQVGIPAKLVIGKAIGNVANYAVIPAWIEVYADNRWITMDPSFDCNNRYFEGDYSEKKLGGKEYFDQTIEDFSKDHKYTCYEEIFFTAADFKPLKDKKVVVPEGFTRIKWATMVDAQSVLQEITLPNTLTGLEESQFEYCSLLEKVKLPDTLTKIPDRTFAYCYDLKSITIPKSVTSIGAYAFGGCDSLTKAVIPSSVKSISKTAFAKITDDYIDGDGIHSVAHEPKNLKIYGEKGSYSETYAKKYKIPFVVMD